MIWGVLLIAAAVGLLVVFPLYVFGSLAYLAILRARLRSKFK